MNPERIYGSCGGLLIRVAGAVLLLGNGRITRASGIPGGRLDGSGGAAAERLAFLAACCRWQRHGASTPAVSQGLRCSAWVGAWPDCVPAPPWLSWTLAGCLTRSFLSRGRRE